VQDAATIMGKHEENKQQPKGAVGTTKKSAETNSPM
jgi:hypothetical protein